MANYNVDISIAIKNTNKLTAFNKQLDKTAEIARQARKDLEEIGQTAKTNIATLNNLSTALSKAQSQFRDTVLGTKASVLAARDLATAERMVNKELKERTALMNKFRFQGGGSAFKSFSQRADQITSPNVLTNAQQKSIDRHNRRRGITPIPFGPQQFIGPLPMQGPMYGPMQGPMPMMTVNNNPRILRNLEASRMSREASGFGIRPGTGYERPIGPAFSAVMKSQLRHQKKIDKNTGKTAQLLSASNNRAIFGDPNAYASPIGPQAARPNFFNRMGFGSRANPRGPFANSRGRAGRISGSISSGLIGGGFPLLFGQGPLAAAGGGVGGLAGGALGGGFGFGLSIAGTAIASRVQETIDFQKAVDKLNVSIRATGGTSLFTAKQIKEFAQALGISKDEALEALKAFQQFEASARITLTKFFGSETIFDTFAGLKDNASIISALPKFSKKLSLEQAKIALETLKTNGASAAELKLRELIFDKNTDILKQEREKGNFFGISKDIGLGDLLNPFRGLEFGKGEGNFFQQLKEGTLITTKTVEELKKNRVEGFFDSDKFKQELEDAKEKLRIQKEFNEELERQAIIKAPVDELNKLLDPLRQIDSLSKNIGDSFAESFKGIVKGSMSAQDALRNLFQRTADHFLDMAAQILAAQVRSGIMGLFANSFGGGTTDVFAGMNRGPTNPDTLTIDSFANGGKPPVGRASLVGERGPELFVPNSAGTIIPNHAMGGMNIVVNVDASGSSVEGDEQQGRELGRAISAAVQSEILQQKRPGGLLA